MLNYTKVRQSVQKTSSKKSLTRGISHNKSHTSSIIKLNQDISNIEPLPIPLKTIFKQKCQPYLKSKKYSVKLSSQEKQNMGKRKQTIHEVQLRPFQQTNRQTNRYLQTQRISKDRVKHQRSLTKHVLKLKTQHSQIKLKTQHHQPMKSKNQYQQPLQLKTQYTQTDRYRRDARQTISKPNSKVVKVPANELKQLMKELMKQQRQVDELTKQLQFFRKHAGKAVSNGVLQALRH